MYDREGKVNEDESPADVEAALVVRFMGFPDEAMLELPWRLAESVEKASFPWEFVRRRDPRPDILDDASCV